MSYPTIPWPIFADLKQMLHGFWASKPTHTESQYPDLQDKVVIVTGGNTGLGYETVKSLAGSTKARIYVFSRNKEKTLAAIKQIQLEIAEEYNVSNSDIRFIQVDLSDLTTIKPAVEEFLKQEQRIDIIIHNAGIMGPPVGSKSKQGYELQWGTNVVGPHLLQRLLIHCSSKQVKLILLGSAELFGYHLQLTCLHLKAESFGIMLIMRI